MQRKVNCVHNSSCRFRDTQYREFLGNYACGDSSGNGTALSWSTSYGSMKQEASTRVILLGATNNKTCGTDMMSTWPDRISDMLLQIRRSHPLIHHITNNVVTNFTANVTLCIGARPVMSSCTRDACEMVACAASLVLNIGTLDESQMKAMLLVGHKAGDLGIPVVLDPVGVGGTKFRTECAQKLIEELNIAVVCGNAGEILTLAGISTQIRGVDSIDEARAHDEASIAAFARERGVIAVVTGEIDRVTDGYLFVRVFGGHPIMKRVTGMGCAATTAIACFTSIAPRKPLDASVAALVVLGIAGEIAFTHAQGPGTFVPCFLDTLTCMDSKTIHAHTRIQETQTLKKDFDLLSGDSRRFASKGVKFSDLTLYLVTDPVLAKERAIEWICEKAFQVGVRIVQLRDKNAPTRYMIEQARRVRECAVRYHACVLVNDRVDVALASCAHGVHLGQNDMSVRDARSLMGPGLIIGVSVHTQDQVREAGLNGADYVAVSPVFATTTKPDAEPVLGLKGVQNLRSVSQLPVVAIGGINAQNAARVIAAGADGIAVVSAIVSAKDVSRACKELFASIEQGRKI